MKKVSILIVLVLGCFIESKAQKVALKSNLLYDATTTMNLGLEFGLARKCTTTLRNLILWPASYLDAFRASTLEMFAANL